jgi:nicotinamidase-related amidase
MKALLIIDMQNGCLIPYSRRYDTLGIISRINQLSEKFRAKKYPVIFIRHDGTSENELIPHTEAWNLIPDLIKMPADLYIDKTANDSFYKTALQQTMLQLKIDELFITGSATDFCVDATIKSALARDYKITVISDCHTTEDKPNLPASALIQYYNWIWTSMSPTKYKIVGAKAEEIQI